MADSTRRNTNSNTPTRRPGNVNRTTGSTNRQTGKTGKETADPASRKKKYAEETPEQRKARLERNRKRREQKEKQRKKEKMIRWLKIGAAVLAAVIALIFGVRMIRNAGDGRTAGDTDSAGGEAAEIQTMKATEVLHLSFPVLHLDPDKQEEEEASEEPELLYDEYTGTWYYADETEEEETAEEEEPQTESPLTVTEFNEILEELYHRGYVLIDIESVAVTTSDGQIQSASVDVPVGKKPLIISQYNVSYESGYNGYADSLIVDASGNITCTYTDTIGDVRRGAVDVVPLLEKFIGAHPDFSYNGARGVIGLTGYRGIFGHAIEPDGSVVGALTAEAIAAAKEKIPETYTYDIYGNLVVEEETDEEAEAPVVSTLTEEDIEANVDICKDVLNVLRQNNWKIACGTYGYVSYASDLDRVKQDQAQWDEKLAGIVGETEILMLPLQGDLDVWSGYSGSNGKYTYLREKGFRFFCVDEDEAPAFLQITPEYVRMGTHEITSWAKYRTVAAKVYQDTVPTQD